MRLSPDYEAAMTADDRAASMTLPAQVGGLHPMALEHVREGRFDVLCSHPLGRADWAAAWTEGFREAGYRVGVAFVAADFAESSAAIEERYRRSRREQGFGRWMPPEHHDRFYAGVPNTAEVLETHRLADALYVVSRDGALLYAARLTPGGEWDKEPFARTALEAARTRRVRTGRRPAAAGPRAPGRRVGHGALRPRRPGGRRHPPLTGLGTAGPRGAARFPRSASSGRPAPPGHGGGAVTMPGADRGRWRRTSASRGTAERSARVGRPPPAARPVRTVRARQGRAAARRAVLPAEAGPVSSGGRGPRRRR